MKNEKLLCPGGHEGYSVYSYFTLLTKSVTGIEPYFMQLDIGT